MKGSTKATRIAAPILLLVVAATAWWLHSQDSPTAAERTNQVRSAKGAQSTDPASGTGFPTTDQAIQRLAKPVSPLMREFTSARRLKELHDRLVSSNSRNGEEDWVLAQIIERCAADSSNVDLMAMRDRFAAALSPKDPTREKRLAAFDRMHVDRCDGLRGMSGNQTQLDALIDRAATAGVPGARLKALTRAARLGGVLTEEMFNGAREIVAMRDPQAMRDASVILAFGTETTSLRAGPNQQDIDINAFRNAWALAACDLGDDCGPDSPRLATACEGPGFCDARDVRDLILNYESSSAGRQRIAEYYAGITRIIEYGDWSYFTMVRGPTPARAMLPPTKPKP